MEKSVDLPLIQDEQLCIPFSSLKKGESVTEQEIIRFCREYLANYKLPKQTIFMDSLPKTATGRIHKEELRK